MSIEIPDYSKSCEQCPLNHDELERIQNLGYKVEKALPRVANTRHHWVPIDTEEGKKILGYEGIYENDSFRSRGTKKYNSSKSLAGKTATD